MKKIKSLLCLAALWLSSFLGAQNVYTLTPTEKPVQCGNKFLFLQDASTKQTLNDVLQSHKFVANTDDVPNYDVTPDAIWGKIKLTCTEKNQWYLTLDPSALTKITFYQKRGNGPWQQTDLGTSLPYGNQIFTGHTALKLDVLPTDTTLLLFRVYDYEPLQFDIKVGQLNSFVNPFHENDVYFGLCFGVMLMMFIYNLYLFVTQKHIIYLYYLLYVFFNGIFLAVFVGYFFHLLPMLRSLTLWDPVIFPVGFGTFLLLFTRDLFKGLLSKRHLRIVYIFMGIIIADALLGAVGFRFLSFDLIRPLGLILGLVCISMGVVGLRKGSAAAKFYLIGFGSYLSGLAFLILSGHLIPANSVAIMALITGSMIECVFLSFAQADKLKVFEQEKEKAQREVLEQVQKNEKLTREQNMVLEQKVTERTAELAEKNKEVTDSIHYAKRIQNTLLAHETLMKECLPEHFILFKPKDIVSGDFYWATKKDNDFYLAVCDSTGHGVPGAFMSLLNITFLSEAINEKDISQPNEVFNYVRNHLINSISRDGGRDGMDGVLVKLSPPTPQGGLKGYSYETADPILYGKLKDFVKEHRSVPTNAENVFWELVRTKKMEGHKFRRQHIIGQYIVDFVCLTKKLIIEIDGLIHQLPDNKISDEERTRFLNKEGFTVLRFTNEEVIGNPDGVSTKVLNALNQHSTKLPPLEGGEAVMSYAAANNDILIVRNKQLIELAADKMPVGQGEILKSFTEQHTQLQKGDMVYLFTDGYADQFGGPKGKKFKYRQLLDKLVEISQWPLAEQHKLMDQTFESWKGDLEQIDDVLVIGIRV